MLDYVKELFPISPLIDSIGDQDLNSVVKVGLARMMICLFDNTEKLSFVTRPNLLIQWETISKGRGRISKLMDPHLLEKLKDLIQGYLNTKELVNDPKLLYELLRLLTYLTRYDFAFVKPTSELDWKEKFRKTYLLISAAFSFSLEYLEQLPNEIVEEEPKKEEDTMNTSYQTVQELPKNQVNQPINIPEEIMQNTRKFCLFNQFSFLFDQFVEIFPYK